MGCGTAAVAGTGTGRGQGGTRECVGDVEGKDVVDVVVKLVDSEVASSEAVDGMMRR